LVRFLPARFLLCRDRGIRSRTQCFLYWWRSVLAYSPVSGTLPAWPCPANRRTESPESAAPPRDAPREICREELNVITKEYSGTKLFKFCLYLRYSLTVFPCSIPLRYSLTVFPYGIPLRYSLTVFPYGIPLRYSLTVFP